MTVMSYSIPSFAFYSQLST